MVGRGVGLAPTSLGSTLAITVRVVRRFLFFAAVSALTRALVLPIPIVDIDEASYIVGAWELLRGRMLYSQIADHHPPAAYLYYALANLMLGRGMFSVRLLTHLTVVPLTALAASAFFRHDRRGLVAGLLYLVYGASFLAHDMLSVNCELLLLLPAAWAVVAVRDERRALRPGRQLVAGCLLGIAVLFKYQAVLWLPALVFSLLLAARARATLRPAFAGLAAHGVGVGLPLVACYAFFAARGAGPDFLYWNFTHNLSYTANPILASEAVPRGVAIVGGFVLATLPLWWGLGKGLPSLESSYQRSLALGLVLLTIPAGFLGFRFYPHYFVQLYWPLSIAAAPALVSVLDPLGRAGRLVAGHAAMVLVGFTLANGWLYYAEHTVYTESRAIFVEMGERLKRDRCYRGASMFVWGYSPGFYFRSGLPPASRFLFLESTIVGYIPGNRATVDDVEAARRRISSQHWDWLMADLQRSRPTFVLDTAPSGLQQWQNFPIEEFPRLAEFLRGDYEDVGSLGGVRIYRRVGCGFAPRVRG